jgi:hypothetical protein
MMKQFSLMIGMLLMSSLAQAKDLVVNVGGKDVTVKYNLLSREISEKDQDKGSQNSAVECSFLYYSLLAKGDIAGASQLATDPAAVAQEWGTYQERLGGVVDFKKEMAAYFTSKNMIIAELLLAEESMLVVKTPDYTAGQLYQKKNGKYVVSGKPLSDAAKALGKVLNMINEGKVKL